MKKGNRCCFEQHRFAVSDSLRTLWRRLVVSNVVKNCN